MADIKDTESTPCKLGFVRPDEGTLLIQLAGSCDWGVKSAVDSCFIFC